MVLVSTTTSTPTETREAAVDTTSLAGHSGLVEHDTQSLLGSIMGAVSRETLLNR